jgi:hypothetical protein
MLGFVYANSHVFYIVMLSAILRLDVLSVITLNFAMASVVAPNGVHYQLLGQKCVMSTLL